MKKVFNKISIKGIIAFLLGVISSFEIVYLFVVGNTPINIAFPFSLVCLICFLISDHRFVSKTLSVVPLELKLFSLFILLSVFGVALLHLDSIITYLVGIIFYLLCVVVFLLVVYLRDYYDLLFKGVVVGLAINFFFCLYGFILHKNGIVFSLLDYFPAINPSKNNPWTYRAYGIFGEPGYLMRYICVFAIPTLMYAFRKKRIIFLVFVGMLVFMIAYSLSSSILFFAAGIIAFVAIVFRYHYKKIVLSIASVAYLMLIAYSFGFKIEEYDFYTSITTGFLRFFDFSSNSNSNRLIGFSYSFEIIQNYPMIGCGFNMFTTVFRELGFYSEEVQGSYSYSLQLIAELGLFSLFFFVPLIRDSFALITCKQSKMVSLGIAGLLYFCMMSFTNYSFCAASSIFMGVLVSEAHYAKRKIMATKLVGQRLGSMDLLSKNFY